MSTIEHDNSVNIGHGDPNPIRRKLLVVGDGACGKTSLLLAYKEDRFNKEYVPTIFENTRACVQVEHRTVELDLWDTAGKFFLLFPRFDVFFMASVGMEGPYLMLIFTL
jgi:hypothetical protein